MADPFASAPLPEAVYRLLPELRGLDYPQETRADCGRCVMLPAHSGESPERPWAFNPLTRCCTYNPVMPNFLLGRTLRRGGPGAARIKARLADPVGVSGWGIKPQPEASKAYHERKRADFGRSEELRCPYWVGGEHACGIWHDRPAVCRTWFCKHDGGEPARDTWNALEDALTEAFDDLARWCLKQGGGPADGATSKAYVRWFQWCAGRVDAMTAEEATRLTDTHLAAARAILRRVAAQPPPPRPDVVVASVSWREDDPDTTMIIGYSTFDGIRVPRSIYLFLSKLDGTRPWREALAEARAEGATVTEAHVAELFRVGALRGPEAGDIRDPRRSGDMPEIFIHHQDGKFADLSPGDMDFGLAPVDEP